MSKLYIAITFLFLSNLIALGQNKEERVLLKTDTTWIKEIFNLPTGFAQEMTVSGFEEAVFPPGWSKVESPQLWSYIFAWSVDMEQPMELQSIENNLEIYFDGLMGVPKDTIVGPKLPTTALLIETTIPKGIASFAGKVRTFDRFRSNEMMTLHVLVTQHFCEKQQKAIVVFRFSPKEFTHEVWELLNSVPLRKDACEIP